MFGFKKKEKKPLWIMAKDVMEIIHADYKDNMCFALIEFIYEGEHYLMGSLVIPPDADERKENIYFVFQDSKYQYFEEFEDSARINGVKVSELSDPIEIIRAGIIGNDTMLTTPWGDTRLKKKALNQ